MSASRSAANARLMQQHQRRQSAAQARSFAFKFTQKQSHFERKREEEQLQHAERSTAVPVTMASAGDGLLSRQRWGPDDAAGGDAAVEAPSAFAMHRRAKQTPLDGAQATTQSATLGISQYRGDTRATRRASRFSLADASAAPAPLASAADAGAGGLLGTARHRRREDDDVADAEELPGKRTRAERFQEMIANRKARKADQQHDREQQETETRQLDDAINGLLHLLPRRDKEQEEREAFMRSGTPAVRALLRTYKENHVAKQLRVDASGRCTITPLAAVAKAQPEPEPTSYLDATDQQLLAKVRRGAARSGEEEATEELVAPPTGASRDAARQAASDVPRQQQLERATAYPEEDEFDHMLNAMRLDTRRARATDRTLTAEEEEAVAAQQEQLEADRRVLPTLDLLEKERLQLTRGEWMQQGGDAAYQMHEDGGGDDDDNIDLGSSYGGESGADGEEVEVGLGAVATDDDEPEEDPTAPHAAPSATATSAPLGGSATLDRLLSSVEAIARSAEMPHDSPAEAAKASEQRSADFIAVLTKLHRYARTHVLEVANAFRMILIEAERSFLRGQRRALSRPLLLYLHAAMKLFPQTDYRHEVSTPLLLFLCSTLMQMRLLALEDVHCYLALATMLTNSLLLAGSRFAAEVLVAPLNVLALQLPRSAMEPARYQGLKVPLPLVERAPSALLASPAAEPGAAAPVAQLELLNSTCCVEGLLLCAYRLLDYLADAYRGVPALPAMLCEPFFALDRLLTEPAAEWRPATEVRAAHEALATKLRAYATAAEDHRTPLAMRQFRPRPIRQFEPLLAEQEANAVKNEVRLMKREIREDKKRVVRHVTAEATVQRRAYEKEAALQEAQRERRYNQVMGQLQSQQHLMNSVDTIMTKAKAKQKKGISGAPKKADEDGGVPEL